mmetsp:Transcript_41604/g.120615  ORF Transcript_41604/g.120615 Transcript_41604/m.120615 type:complete len:801 (+) Transcript_41604:73-2475(+)
MHRVSCVDPASWTPSPSKMKFLCGVRLAFVALWLLPGASASQPMRASTRGLLLTMAQTASGAMLQRAQQASKATLDGTADDLGAILDTAVSAWSEVDAAFGAIAADCTAQVTKFGEGSATGQAQVSTLTSSRIENLATQVRLQAELDALSAQEEIAQSSFDSTVAQRAAEAHAYTKTTNTSSLQRQMISQVLTKMREKQVAMTVSSEVPGQTSPNLVEPGERLMFLRSSTYPYPAECAQSMGVVVLQVDAAADPPIQVRWDSGFEYWVKLEDLREVHRMSGSSGATSGFQTIIGVFEGMLQSIETGQADDSKDHTESDAELFGLVTSYKDRLQHIDAEYERINGQRATAEGIATDALVEINLRGSIDREYNALLSEFQDMCGYGGTTSNSGILAEALMRGNMFTEQLKTQVEQALLVINALTSAQPADATVLFQRQNMRGSSMARFVQPKAPLLAVAGSGRTPPSTVMSTERRGRATKWLLDARARGLKAPGPFSDAQPRHGPFHTVDHNLEGAVNMGARGSPKRVTASSSAASLHSLGAPSATAGSVSKARAGHLAGGVGILNAVATGVGNTHALDLAGRTSGDLPQDWQHCVDQKQALTAKILTARQEARTARSTKALSDEKSRSLSRWVAFMETRETEVASSRTSFFDAFSQMNQVISGNTFDTSLLNALEQLGQVQAAVDAYMAADPPPAASGLPYAMSTIRNTMESFRADMNPRIEEMSPLYQDMTTNSQALLTRIDTAKNLLITVRDTTQALGGAAAATVSEKEALEKTLMDQRMELEAECEIVMRGGSAAAGA